VQLAIQTKTLGPADRSGRKNGGSVEHSQFHKGLSVNGEELLGGKKNAEVGGSAQNLEIRNRPWQRKKTKRAARKSKILDGKAIGGPRQMATG